MSTRYRDGATAATHRLVSLDVSLAAHPAVVGVKAARLAAARRAGLPALPGVVVPVAAGRDAIAYGAEALVSGQPAAARRAVSSEAIDPALADALYRAGARLGAATLVARSSTSLDDDGGFAGAFVSLGDLAADELPTALLSCWASLFAPAVLERLRLRGLTAREVGLAVLVQPQVKSTAGGWAAIVDDGVEIAATDGHPGPLLAGLQPGIRDHVVPGRDSPGNDVLDRGDVAAVAELATLAATRLGVNRIEWAFADGRLLLLQASRASSPGARRTAAPRAMTVQATEPAAARFAELLRRRRGPLADTLLLPWAGAAWSPVPTNADGSAVELHHQMLRNAAALRRAVSRALEPAPASAATGSPGATALAAQSAVAVHSPTASRLLASATRLGDLLSAQGVLPSAESLWQQSPGWLEAALAGNPPPASTWRATSRCQELLYELCVAFGDQRAGTAAAPGHGVGDALFVEPGTQADWPDLDGRVVMASAPTPALAPYLWRAAGLVTEAGSFGAHLCEVARSLHLPAVVGVGPMPKTTGALLAVDGDRGTVHIWRPGSDTPIL